MALVFSPSNMATYRDCPRRFQAQSITKELPYKPSQQKSRGTLVHELMGKALYQPDSLHAWPEGVDVDFVNQKLSATRALMNSGFTARLEHELVIKNDFTPSDDWWDEDAFLRARADMTVIGFDKSCRVVDFKTGKVWDKDSFQLRVEALMLHLIYDVPQVFYSYWYVDAGEEHGGSLDFSGGLHAVQDVIDNMRRMQDDIRSNAFFPKRNRFCRFCDLQNTPRCGL